MASAIIYCEKNPIQTDIDDWQLGHLGRYSVGRERTDKIYEILAYSDNKQDAGILRQMARKMKVIFIQSNWDEGMNAIDENVDTCEKGSIHVACSVQNRT